MVLCLKARESRSLPGLPNARNLFWNDFKFLAHGFAAGWSSPVARQAHNLKVVGSNPAPATIETDIPAAAAAGMSVFLFGPIAWAPIQCVRSRQPLIASGRG